MRRKGDITALFMWYKLSASCRKQVTFRRDDDDIRFVLDQQDDDIRFVLDQQDDDIRFVLVQQDY
jgi:biotin-(acetyl-CoA carboxylase) ligase